MQAKEPAENILTTRQVSDLVEELVGTRPTPDQIRDWCRQGYVAPEELPPIHLEHVRNRQGHYEITEESVRRFIEMRRRRETNLLAFVKWCRQRSAELQSRADTESAATPPEPADAGDDEPAPEWANESFPTETTFVDELGQSDPREESTSQAPAASGDDESTRLADEAPETAIEPSVAQPIMADAADDVTDDLLVELVVEESGEDIEDDFFNAFIEDDQRDADSDDVDSTDDDDDEAARESAGGGVLTAISDAAVDSSRIELPEPDLPWPESFNAGLSQDDSAIDPVDDFGSFDESPSHREGAQRGLRGFRSRRSRQSSRHSHATPLESGAESREQVLGDQISGDSTEPDAFSFGIFESANESQQSECVEIVADEKSPDLVVVSVDSEDNADDNAEDNAEDNADDNLDSILPVDEVSPEVIKARVIEAVAGDPPIVQSEPVIAPIAAKPEPEPTLTHPVAPVLSLPEIKPLPPNSPLLPNFGAPRVSSPLRPETQNQKPAARPTQNQATSTYPPRRTNAPATRRGTTKHSAQLDQLAAAYAAFTSGAAPAVMEPGIKPESRESTTSSPKASPKPAAPAIPAMRRDNDSKHPSVDRAVDDHALAADAVRCAAQTPEASPQPRGVEAETRAPRTSKVDRTRTAAQVSRYLWLWVTAIALGWACFGVSFVIKDDFGVIALSSIAVAATGMSGLWWTGK